MSHSLILKREAGDIGKQGLTTGRTHGSYFIFFREGARTDLWGLVREGAESAAKKGVRLVGEQATQTTHLFTHLPMIPVY